MSLARVKKSLLRDAARFALEGPDATIEEVPGRGRVPGSLLRVLKPDQRDRRVAVRVSLDREIALTRDSTGWLSLPKVDQVVCGVPAADGSDSVEVLSFDPSDLIDAADAALAIQKEANPNLSDKAPVFVSLDGSVDSPFSLRSKASWKTLIPLAKVRAVKTAKRESPRETLERARHEIAAAYGMLPTEVHIRLEPLIESPTLTSTA